MKLRALLVLGLLPGCFLFGADEAEEVEGDAMHDCPCDGVCGFELTLGPDCNVRDCSCDSGRVCRGGEAAGAEGRCEEPCIAQCEVGECGVKRIEGCPRELDKPCRCPESETCILSGGQELGTCVAAEDFECPPGAVEVAGPACTWSAAHCFDPPTLMAGQLGSGERNLDGALGGGPVSLAVTTEADGRWLWFLTTRYTHANHTRLARARLTDDGLGLVEGSIESFETLTPADVHWTYEFTLAPDGSELFIGLAAPGPDGWADASLVLHVREGATFRRVGPVGGVENMSGWTHRPALLADRKLLLTNRNVDRQPYLYERETDSPGDASFALRGLLDLGPGFEFVGGTSNGTLSPRALVPGGDGRTFVAGRTDFILNDPSDPERRTTPHSAGLVLVAIPPGAEGPYSVEPLPFPAHEMPDPEPIVGELGDFATAVAFSPDGEHLYQFRHGFFAVSSRQDCP